MRLRPWLGKWSTYTVLGLVGYIVASITVGLLGYALGLDVFARGVAIVMPAIGFIIAVSVARVVVGVERIVFYQAAIAAWLASCAVAWCCGMSVARMSDLVTILVAIFLAFGRVGCLHVGCCHGRPSRFGVHYSHAHVALGFPRRWFGRRIFPIQLVESALSVALAIGCAYVILSRHPAGSATILFVLGYAVARFPLELARGDAGRPYLAGLSEAQWIALATTAVAVSYRPTAVTVAVAVVMVAMAIAVFATHGLPRVLARPRHLDEIERAISRLVARRDAQAMWTTSGLKLSAQTLPNGTIDIVWSHGRLTHHTVEQVAAALFAQPRVVAGQAEGLFHVLVASRHDEARI